MRTLLILVLGVFTGAASAQPKPKQDLKRPGLLKKLGTTNGFGPLQSAFGDSAFSKNRKRIDAAYKTANRAYERGDWAQAITAYKAAWAIDKNKTMMIGGSGKAYQSRASLACEALGRLDCALDAVKARRRSGLSIGLGGRGYGRGGYVSMSERVERAMPMLIKKRAQALKTDDPQRRAQLYSDLLSRDPRCPGKSCPPFTLHEAGEALHAVGKRSRSIKLLEQYLELMPKARNRKAVRQLLTGAKAVEEKADRAAAADVKARRLVIAGGKTTPAPWLRLGTWPAVQFKRMRYGGTVGVAQMRVGSHAEWLGVHHGKSAVGPLKIPDAPQWLGVSLSGGVYYADASGGLFHASDLAAALRPFKRLTTFADVKHWHLSGETLVASGTQTVHVSLDGGRTFTTRRHERPIGKAWARADGVVAFGDETGAWSSRDGGKSWQSEPLGDMRALRRDGQRIFLEPVSPHSHFGGAMNCAQGELSAGGSWVRPTERYGRGGSNGWDTIFAVGNFARSPKTVAGGLGKSAVASGEPALPVVKACRADPEAWFKANRGGAGGMGGFGEPCRGLNCLVHPSLPATPVRFGLLGDARCGREASTSPAVKLVPTRRRRLTRFRRRSGRTTCDALATAGTLIQASPKTIKRRPPIADCRLRWMRSVGGLGIGICQGKPEPELVVLDATGTVRERQALGGPLEQLMMAKDGTIVAQVRQDDTHVAWVRRPIALAQANAWRKQIASKAAAWRPVVGGRALAITPGEIARPRFEIVKSTANGEWMQGPGKSERAAWEACQQSAFKRAPDLRGTATVTRQDDTHVAWVRRPIALAQANAWRKQIASKAAAWRPVVGGRALAITPGEIARTRFEIVKSTANGEWMQGPGKPERAAWEACQQSAFKRAPDLRGTATVTRTIGAKRSVQSVRIDNDVQGSDAAFVRCLHAVAEKAPVPWGKTGELSHVLEFHRDLASYRLVLAEADGSARAVTQDVEFEAPPKAV